MEGLKVDQMMDQRWGEGSDPQVAMKREWEERKAAVAAEEKKR